MYEQEHKCRLLFKLNVFCIIVSVLIVLLHIPELILKLYMLLFCKKIISHRIGKIVPVLARAPETTKNLIMKRKFQEHPSKTMGATNGARTAYPSGAPKFIPGF